MIDQQESDGELTEEQAADMRRHLETHPDSMQVEAEAVWEMRWSPLLEALPSDDQAEEAWARLHPEEEEEG